MKQLWAAAALALAATTAVTAHAAIKVAGVPLMQSAPANGSALWINGAGTVNVGGKTMAAAVYLPQNTTSASDIMTMPGNKAIRLTALSDMPATDVSKFLEAGVRKGTSGAQFASFKPALDAFAKQMAAVKTIPKGETVELLYEPDNGIVLMGPGAHIIPGTGKGSSELYQAILRTLPDSVLSSAAVQKQNRS